MAHERAGRVEPGGTTVELTGWTIDRCGHLADRTVQGVGPHVTVLVGPNEVGKTTTHHFLRWVLVGFPGANQGTFRRYRGDAPAIGGRVRLRHGGRELVLERSAGRGAHTALLDPSGAPVTGLTPADLVGTTTPELYRSVFAIGVDELHDASALQADEVREHIFAAGVVGGGRSAADAIRDLDKRRHALLSPRGGHLRDLARDLGEARSVLAAARARSARLGALRDAADRAEAEAAAVWAQRQDAAAEAELVDGVVALWPAWVARRAAAVELADLTQVELGPDPVARLDALVGEAVATASTRDALASELDDVARRLHQDQPDAHLAGARQQVEDAAQAHSRVQARAGEVADARTRWLDADREARIGVAELGPGWDADRVLASPCTPAAVAELAERGRGVLRADDEVRQARREAAAAQEQLERCRSRLEAAPPTGDGPDPSALHALADALDALAAQGPPATVVAATDRPARTGPPLAVAVVLSVLAAGTLGAAAVTGSVAIAVVGALVLAAAAAAVTARAAGRPAPTDDPTTDRADRADAWARARRLVADRAAAAGLPADADPATVRLLQVQAAEDRRRAERHTELRADVATAQAAAARATEQVTTASVRMDAARSHWRDLAAQLDVPADLGVDAADALVGRVAALGGRLRTLRQEQVRLDTAAAQVSAASAAGAALLAELGAPVHDPADPASVADGLDALATRCRDAALAAVERAALADRHADLAGRLELARQEADRRARAVEARLTAAGVEDPDGFRALAAVVAHRDTLRERVRAVDLALTERFGAGETATSARKELELGRAEEWAGRATDARRRVQELGVQHTDLHRQAAGARHQVREAERSADVPTGEMEVDRLTHELADAARDWVRLSLAGQAIATTLDHFERERQPQVVADAARSLERVTAGRWSHLLSGPDGVEVLAPAGTRLAGDRLSRGTVEQLYLCVRLALARSHAERSARLPVLLDDVFVNADDERAQRLAAEVADAAEHLQVIVFTASHATADRLVRARPDTAVIQLEGTP